MPRLSQPAALNDVYCVTCREIQNVRTNEIDKKRYEKAKTLGLCIRCSKNPTLNGKVRCQDCSGIVTKQGMVTGWMNLFNLYLAMGGKCSGCGNEDLQVLVIDHIQYYNHHKEDNGKIWNKLKLSSRQSAKKRLEILQGYKEGKYQLLCANCNRLKELKRIGCDPHIQDALYDKYSGSWNQRTYGWINKFNLLKDMGRRCSKCGVSELAALEIHHTELFHHSKNGLKWKKIQTRLRRNNGVRVEILQGYRAGKYLLLCCNCNRLESHKQVRSEPYIQQALIKLNKLNTNNSVENTFENSHDSIWQIIILNIVVCLMYLFILVWFYRYTKFDVL
jgi:hypothetical protein